MDDSEDGGNGGGGSRDPRGNPDDGVGWRGRGTRRGDGHLRALGDLELLNQDVDPSGTMLVDACNGFNEMSRLAML